ncbi:MAG: undecaprenyl-phosphate glucose phosphotransferase [Rhodobiaceae bacterium]|nr:undecaprenyl-phosphate glucose phosphotransferase [Rhodobiaceae bacterium]MCC0042673.1 undecaprenyl-phosphate glucose phosphotransferase [Rhodobiaceae bacterium]MCC0052958.1 undecaprenyl-phosphate glucose phosphotransferase [Rhodobiaceae bacterium]
MINVSRRWTFGTGLAAVLALIAEFVCVAGGIMGAHFAYHEIAYGSGGSLTRILAYAFLTAFGYIGVNLLRGGYDTQLTGSGRGGDAQVFLIWNTAFVISLFVLFISKTVEEQSRGGILLSYAVGLAAAYGARIAIGALARKAVQRGMVRARSVLLVGHDTRIEAFVAAQTLQQSGISVIDAVVLPTAASAADVDAALRVAVERARELEPDDIVLAIGLKDAEALEAAVDAMANVPASLHVMQDGVFERFRDIESGRIGEVAGLVLSRQRLTAFDQAAKRLFDIVVSLVALVLLSPLLLVITLAIRLESGSPVLFSQTRYGFNEEPFRILKFRTMTVRDDGAVVRQATLGDKRITRLGRFLRRSSLDELPQLVNVLAGDMSLVGPRPHAVAHNRYYEQRVARYARRHNVKPGITGWAQVNGLRGETDTDDKMARRVACDLYYLDNWSFRFDLKILALTLVTMLGGRNAY